MIDGLLAFRPLAQQFFQHRHPFGDEFAIDRCGFGHGQGDNGFFAIVIGLGFGFQLQLLGRAGLDVHQHASVGQKGDALTRGGKQTGFALIMQCVQWNFVAIDFERAHL